MGKFNAPQPRHHYTNPEGKSKGILDDYGERQVIDTREGTIQNTPTLDKHIVNKKYVDDEVAGAGGTDWTVSQAPSVVHADNYTDTGDTTDHTALSNIGTQTHAQLETAIALNTAKDTNVSTDLSAGTRAPTTIDVNSSDGSNATLVEADTTNAGILGSDKWDEIVANTVHKSSNGQNHADVVSNNTHRADNTQAHSDYLLNSGNDTTSGTITAAGFTTTGVTLTGDHGTAATDQVVNVCYGTGDPPTANTTTIGSLFVKYTA